LDYVHRYITSFCNDADTSGDIHIEGGPIEIVIKANQMNIVISGEQGMRKIKIPGVWKVKGQDEIPVVSKNGLMAIDYLGNDKMLVTLEKE